jgi:hypothetical protein
VLKIPEKVSGFFIHMGCRFFDEYIINRRFRLQKAMFSIPFGRFSVFGLSWHGRCNMSCEPHEKLTNQPKPTLRRFIMLTIKDLPVAKSLDCKEMAAVSGGTNKTSIGAFYQDADQGGKGNVNTNVGIFAPVVTNLDVSNVGNTSSFAKQHGMRF